MSRSREYTYARRLMMQLCLCGTLAATTALAWWVGKTHAASLAVTLSSPARFGNGVANIDLRLPVGWTIETDVSDVTQATLAATERSARFGSPRKIWIRLYAIASDVPTPSIEDVARSEMNDRPADPPTPVDFLGARGALYQYPAAHGTTEEGQTIYWKPALFACTVLANPKVVVTARLIGVHSLTPAPIDIDLIRQVIGSMTIADSSKPVTTVGSPPGPDWRPTAADADAADANRDTKARKKRLEPNDKDDDQ